MILKHIILCVVRHCRDNRSSRKKSSSMYPVFLSNSKIIQLFEAFHMFKPVDGPHFNCFDSKKRHTHSRKKGKHTRSKKCGKVKNTQKKCLTEEDEAHFSRRRWSTSKNRRNISSFFLLFNLFFPLRCVFYVCMLFGCAFTFHLNWCRSCFGSSTLCGNEWRKKKVIDFHSFRTKTKTAREKKTRHTLTRELIKCTS